MICALYFLNIKLPNLVSPEYNSNLCLETASKVTDDNTIICQESFL